MDRSANMRAIRSKGTKPEMCVRRFVHGLGYRYRLHVSGLPGTPDLVFPRMRKVIFVHGCFWHMHQICRDGRIPESRRDYWEPKLLGNVKRGRKNLAALRRLGWRPLVVWECELEDPARVQKKLTRFLNE